MSERYADFVTATIAATVTATAAVTGAVTATAAVTATSRALTAQAAVVADLLATVVQRLGSSDPAAQAAVDFLHTWADQGRMAAADRPSGGVGPAGRPGGHRPLDAMVNALGLSSAERCLVLLAGLAEEHEGLAGTLRSLHPLGEPRPTVGLAALILAEDGVDRTEMRRLLGSGPAVRHGVLRITGASGLFERSLTLADQLWEALHGVDAAPSGLQRLDLGPVPVGLDGWLTDELVQQAREVVRDNRTASVVLVSAEERIATSRCAALLASVGAQGFAVRVEPSAALAELANQAFVHATLRGAVPVLVLQRGSGDPQAPSPGAGDVGSLPGPVILCATTGSVLLDGARPVLALPTAAVDVGQRRLAWRAMLPGVDENAATRTRRPAAAGPGLDRHRCRRRPRGRSGADACARLGGTAPSHRSRAAARRRAGHPRRGRGAGWCCPRRPASSCATPWPGSTTRRPCSTTGGWAGRRAHTAGAGCCSPGLPGTGKSLAAEALATAAQTDLLRVDLSQIVSKWLGETEKNLAAAFDAAERTQAVLLLDEADALFGSRTEISDAHDRYANLETAYLLQRLDTFDGLLVLTTNLRHNIDAGLPAPDGLRRRGAAARPRGTPRAVAAAPARRARGRRRRPRRPGPAVPDARRLDPQRRPGRRLRGRGRR